MQKGKHLNKYRINTKNNQLWKSSKNRGKECPPEVHKFRKNRERKLFIAKKDTRVENFAPFTRVFRSTKTTLKQSVESIVFNHLAHLYSLVTAVVQELLSQLGKERSISY